MKPQIKIKGRVKYFFLSVPAKDGKWLYHEWYTLTGMDGVVNFPECVVGTMALRNRVSRLGMKGCDFKDLWDCITRPAKKHSDRKAHDYAERHENKEFNKMLLIMKVGSLTGRLLQGKRYE